MIYRDWHIRAYSSFLGYFVRYVSPTGQAHHTSAHFTSGEQALAFARTRVDYLLECQRCRFEPAPAEAPLPEALSA